MRPRVRGERRLSGSAVRWTALVLAVVACGDVATPLSPEPARLSAQDVDADSTDFFAADVKVTASGQRVADRVPEQRREFTYHVERKREGGSWKTTMTIPPNGLGPSQPHSMDIGRVEIDDATRSAQMYRRDGSAVPLPDTDHPAVIRMARQYDDDAIRTRLRPARGKGEAPQSGSQSGQSDQGQEQSGQWSEGLIVPTTDAHRGRRLGSLERQFGKAKGKVDRLDRYERNDGNRTIEVLVDPNDGVIAESNLAEDGRLVQHTRYAYAQLPGRRSYVRQRMRTEIAPRDASAQPVVIEYTLSNIRLERRGGKP
jgi:hypothetical protein